MNQRVRQGSTEAALGVPRARNGEHKGREPKSRSSAKLKPDRAALPIALERHRLLARRSPGTSAPPAAGVRRLCLGYSLRSRSRLVVCSGVPVRLLSSRSDGTPRTPRGQALGGARGLSGSTSGRALPAWLFGGACGSWVPQPRRLAVVDRIDALGDFPFWKGGGLALEPPSPLQSWRCNPTAAH